MVLGPAVVEAVLKLGTDGTAVAQAKRSKKNSFSTPFKSSHVSTLY